MHCLEARVEIVAQQALDFGSPGEVELALRVAEGDEPKPGDVQVELVQARQGQPRRQHHPGHRRPAL